MEKINAVKMMRNIRDKMTEEYLKDKGLEKKELQKIRKKYGIKKRKSRTFTHSK
jgi:ABC-type microcin C transport system permease subunit YejB